MPARSPFRKRNQLPPSRRARLETYGTSAKVPKGAYYELKRLYFECAHATYPMPMASVRAFAPTTQLLFGTDYPAEPMESTLDQLPNNGLSREVLRTLERGNAERLFPRLKT